MSHAKLGGQSNVKTNGATGTNGHVDPGVSIRFGPVQPDGEQPDGDVEMKDTDGVANASKRKARTSVGQAKSYAEPESSEEDEPLVHLPAPPTSTALLPLLSVSTADYPTEQTSSHFSETRRSRDR